MINSTLLNMKVKRFSEACRKENKLGWVFKRQKPNDFFFVFSVGWIKLC